MCGRNRTSTLKVRYRTEQRYRDLVMSWKGEAELAVKYNDEYGSENDIVFSLLYYTESAEMRGLGSYGKMPKIPR